MEKASLPAQVLSAESLTLRNLQGREAAAVFNPARSSCFPGAPELLQFRSSLSWFRGGGS